MMVATYLRRGQRSVERALLDPRLRAAVMVTAYGGTGFLMSGTSLWGAHQPVAAGLICAGTGWRALVMSLGAMVGYGTFWGNRGQQGMVWSAACGLLALLLGKREEAKQQPLMIPAIGSFLIGVTGLVFRFLLGEDWSVPLLLLHMAVVFGTGVLFTQAARQRDAVTGWLMGGMATMALASCNPVSWLGLGYLAAGFLGARDSLPAAALAGMGLDLARVTQVPMTAVLCTAWLVRMIPFDKKWQHDVSVVIACLAVMGISGVWDPTPLPGILAGSILGSVLPPRAGIPRSRGQTGVAQVRLELGAEVMGQMEMLLNRQERQVDRDAIFHRAVDRACGRCPARKGCRERVQLSGALLMEPSDAMCREAARLQGELFRGRDQLAYLQRSRKQLREFRLALRQQYHFLERYLRDLADQLPRSHSSVRPMFRVEAAARSRGRERANGDRCLAFPGPGCRFYLLLCDGMGTGLAAAREGAQAAGLLKKMLEAGFPPDQALSSVNSLLILQNASGAVTVDLVQIQLDTGLAVVYKWGAAPSWVLYRSGPKKIGTASPPPGITLEGAREQVEKLSLCRGEPLIILSDGVDGEVVLHRLGLPPDAPPGELAAEILEKGCSGEMADDATALVVRLRPVNLATS